MPATPTSRAQPAWREVATVLGLVSAVALVAYRKSFAVPFQFDDLESIVDNPYVHLARFDLEGLSRAATGTRPIATLSLALNYWVSPAPLGFHVVNLLIHVAAALLVFVVARQVFAALRPGEPSGLWSGDGGVALVAALLFAAHPVHTQAVTYVVQRMASLGALASLVATALWLSAPGARRRWPRRAGAVVAWLLALGCKEAFVVLPAVLLVVDAVLGRVTWRRTLGLLGVAAGLVGAAGASLVASRWEFLLAEYGRFGVTLSQRLVEQPRVLFYYLSLLVFPLPGRLRADLVWPLAESVPAMVLPAVALAVGVAGAVWARRRAPLVTFAVAWFLGLLAVEQSVTPIDLYFEHRLYLPSVGPLLLVAVAAGALARRLAWPVTALAAPVVVLLVVATDARNALWRDPEALHRQAIAAGEGTPRSWIVVGSARLDSGDLVGAEAAYRQALVHSPRNGTALNNLGQVRERAGDAAGAEQLYRAAFAAEPRTTTARLNLVVLLARGGQFEAATAEADAWVAQAPSDAQAWYGRGVTLALQGRHADAREAFTRALTARPDFLPALRDRGVAALQLGRPGEAVADLERAVALSRPAKAQALRELGLALEQAGRAPEAIVQYEAALRIEPDPRLADYVAKLRAQPR